MPLRNAAFPFLLREVPLLKAEAMQQSLDLEVLAPQL